MKNGSQKSVEKMIADHSDPSLPDQNQLDHDHPSQPEMDLHLHQRTTMKIGSQKSVEKMIADHNDPSLPDQNQLDHDHPSQPEMGSHLLRTTMKETGPEVKVDQSQMRVVQMIVDHHDPDLPEIDRHHHPNPRKTNNSFADYISFWRQNLTR